MPSTQGVDQIPWVLTGLCVLPSSDPSKGTLRPWALGRKAVKGSGPLGGATGVGTCFRKEGARAWG